MNAFLRCVFVWEYIRETLLGVCWSVSHVYSSLKWGLFLPLLPFGTSQQAGETRNAQDNDLGAVLCRRPGGDDERRGGRQQRGRGVGGAGRRLGVAVERPKRRQEGTRPNCGWSFLG